MARARVSDGSGETAAGSRSWRCVPGWTAGYGSGAAGACMGELVGGAAGAGAPGGAEYQGGGEVGSTDCFSCSRSTPRLSTFATYSAAESGAACIASVRALVLLRNSSIWLAFRLCSMLRIPSRGCYCSLLMLNIADSLRFSLLSQP